MSVQFVRRTVLLAAPARCFDLSLDVDFHLESFNGSDETIVGGCAMAGWRSLTTSHGAPAASASRG